MISECRKEKPTKNRTVAGKGYKVARLFFPMRRRLPIAFVRRARLRESPEAIRPQPLFSGWCVLEFKSQGDKPDVGCKRPSQLIAQKDRPLLAELTVCAITRT